MSDVHVQVGDRIHVPVESVLLVKGKGVKTEYTMFIHSGLVYIDTMLQTMPKFVSRVFFHLACTIPPTQGNIVSVQSRELAAQYQRPLGTIQNVLSLLVSNKYMKRIEKGKFALNPHIVWSGRTVERLKACVEWDEWIEEMSNV